MACGRFISIEGGEGAGKSTQAERLCAALRNRGLDVVATREPGGSPGAEDIRRLLVSGATDRWDATTEVLLHFAARRDHLVKTVLPALARGAWVVSDRFADSTTAYQGYAHGLGVEPVAFPSMPFPIASSTPAGASKTSISSSFTTSPS